MIAEPESMKQESMFTFRNYRVNASEQKIWQDLIQEASGDVNVEAIILAWLKAKKQFEIYNRQLPEPVWKKRGYDDSGQEAWFELSQKIIPKSPHNPLAIYLHLPFCDTRCPFCDCYTIAKRKSSSDVEHRYTEALLHEMDTWKHLSPIQKQPVSTIHFGGGTPNGIEPALFERIVRHCNDSFLITPKTELAIESISSLLEKDHLLELKQLGFSRLHIGLQTLDNNLRQLIGRRETANEVLEKIRLALSLGFVVTVDLILGLPNQSVGEFLDSLKKLTQLGVHGFSFYQLQVSAHNRRFIQKVMNPAQSPLLGYVLFQLGESWLNSNNYHKNHFDHFSLKDDHNLYSTHMSRGENLLALGASSDGVFNAYHYRHPTLNTYLKQAKKHIAVLEGGLWQNKTEKHIQPLLAQIMTGKIQEKTFSQLHAHFLKKEWIDSAFLRKEENLEEYVLTANGSWFINNMLEQAGQITQNID
jgi:coproporphyrinogen III oxidase-like Fe-S oxidoreductase